MRVCNLEFAMPRAMLVALLVTGVMGVRAAQAQTVRITEIWQDGNSSVPDWFELTNDGDTATDPSAFYYDDESRDPTIGANLAGITNLNPGESGIYLVSWNDDFASFGAAVTAFDSFWGTDGAYQIGYILDGDGDGGPGLGGGGDEVNVYDGSSAGANLLARQQHGAGNDSQTWVIDPAQPYDPLASGVQNAQFGVLGAFTSVDGTQIGSPGVVPEPSSIALAALGIAGCFWAWRK